MKKMFFLQKFMFVIYILAMISIMLYALGFMTNYKAFQYLVGVTPQGVVIYPHNVELAEYHHEHLIPYNNTIFYLALGSVISIVLVFIAKINKKLPTVLNYILAGVSIIPTIIASVFSIVKLPTLLKMYNTYDFSEVEAETYNPYTPSTTAFEIGNILYPIVLGIVVVFFLVVTINFLNNRKNVKQNVVA